MDESAYFAGENPYQLLFGLHADWVTGRVGQPERRLRLFACACCRRVWHLLAEGRGRSAVELVERHADGRASDDELRAAADAAEAAWRDAGGEQEDDLTSANPVLQAARAASCAVGRWPGRLTAGWSWYGRAALAADGVRAAVQAEAGEAGQKRRPATEAEVAAHLALLRDALGNPFRPSPAVDPGWLAWQDGAVRKLAEGIYDERAFDQLPVLADAVEEAGCTSAGVLNHCRRPGVHVYGVLGTRPTPRRGVTRDDRSRVACLRRSRADAAVPARPGEYPEAAVICRRRLSPGMAPPAR
jgi:hypothetical protein